MKVIAYPADDYGCGHHRIIWPAQYLAELGYDVSVVGSKDRHVRLEFSQQGELLSCDIGEEFDVIVLQRTTDHRTVKMVKWLREHGRTVVIDVDDDLSAIHPGNPAWRFLDPHRAEHEVQEAIKAKLLDARRSAIVLNGLRAQYTHSWNHLLEACKIASLVTVSTPGLIRRYAAHGRGIMLPNYLADHYFTVPHEDSDLIGWPAVLHSHPNDPSAVGNALRRLVQDGARFVTFGTESFGAGQAFGLRDEPEKLHDTDVTAWPAALTQLGIGITPLADTLFNSRKSWLKPLELSAVGVPWVASPRAEYTRLHEMGAGALAKDARDWYRILDRLRRYPNLRREVSERGRAVAETLRLRDHCEKWWEAWEYAWHSDRGASTRVENVVGNDARHAR